MQGIVLTEAKRFESLVIREFDYPYPGPGEVTVRVQASALNHRDLWIVQGLYPNIGVPIVLGSDGAGVVDRVGPDVEPAWVGRAAVINPSLDWGGDPRVQGKSYRILGMPDNGTQAEFVRVPEINLAPKPSYLSFAEAAAIPLGGLTGYRALFTQGALRAGETVLLTGIGGGVAALMMQMALAVSARVLVTSGSDSKVQRALGLGAAGGANYTADDWGEKLFHLAQPGGIDLIVDSAGGDGFAALTRLVNPGGRIVFFGATAGNPSGLDMRNLFWKQVRLQGTTMGTPEEFCDMLKLFEAHRIKPLIERAYRFDEFKEAYARMRDGTQFGKLVLLAPSAST
ncbi:MAG: zinc-binding dehydrogenase [Gammaproteobacteria bacterium]